MLDGDTKALEEESDGTRLYFANAFSEVFATNVSSFSVSSQKVTYRPYNKHIYNVSLTLSDVNKTSFKTKTKTFHGATCVLTY